MSTKDTVVYNILPEISEYLGRKGVVQGSWLGLIGAPGSLKSILCMKAAFKWLNLNPKYNVIYVITEHARFQVLEQASELGIDFSKFEAEKRIFFGSIHAKRKEEGEYIDNTREAFATFVSDKKTKILVPKFGWEGRTLLIIDSLASLWEHAPANSRKDWSYVYGNCKNMCDLTIVTAQLSIGTGKSFGFGIEHGVDSLIRLGSFLEAELDEMGEVKAMIGKRWIYIEKMRMMYHDRRLREMFIDPKTMKITIGNPIKIRGRYYNINDALDSLKNEHVNEIQQERNKILSGFTKMFALMISKLEKIEGKIPNEKKAEE